MTESLLLGGTAYYVLEDKGSGLYLYRAVIEDEEERYKKVAWQEAIGGTSYEDRIRWDGKFADGA